MIFPKSTFNQVTLAFKMDKRVIFCENSKWISKTLGPFLAVHDLVDSRDYGDLVIRENLASLVNLVNLLILVNLVFAFLLVFVYMSLSLS